MQESSHTGAGHKDKASGICLMVVVKFLGLMDLHAAIALVFIHSGIVSGYPSVHWAVIAIAFLAFKAIVWRGSFLSFIDISAGLYILLVSLGIKHLIVTAVFAAYLVYKGGWSML